MQHSLSCLQDFQLPDRRHLPAGKKTEQQSDPVLHKFKDQIEEKIKADPDSKCHSQQLMQQRDLCGLGATAHQESSSSAFSPLNSASALLHPSVSCSPIKTSQKMQKHSYHTVTPLPPFSSSFLCRPPIATLSSPSLASSVLPLPSPLHSHPSLPPVGGRKGRVCCGVCGKSFYDKGRERFPFLLIRLLAGSQISFFFP